MTGIPLDGLDGGHHYRKEKRRTKKRWRQAFRRMWRRRNAQDALGRLVRNGLGSYPMVWS